MNGPKVKIRCLSKIWLYAGISGESRTTMVYLFLKINIPSKKVSSADNQQERLYAEWITGSDFSGIRRDSRSEQKIMTLKSRMNRKKVIRLENPQRLHAESH